MGQPPAIESSTSAGAAREPAPTISSDTGASSRCRWRTAGPARRREAWVFENNDRPLALIPLAFWRSHLRRLPVRMVGVLDSPDTPFLELPAIGPMEDVVETFLTRLQQTGGWDLL